MRVKYNLETKITFQVTGPGDKGAACMLHNAMYSYANINAVDLHIAVKKGNLQCVTDAVRSLNFSGFNLGEPHKSDIIALLDEVEPISKAFRCVNTVVNRDGKLYGVGMDGIGMGMALEQSTGSVRGRRVLILGAGAVGGLIPADLCRRGISWVAVANRTVEKAQYVTETLKKHFEVETSFGNLDSEYLNNQAGIVDMVVQCSSVGNVAHPEKKFETLDFVDYLPDHCIVADVNYPTTPLLERAKARGLRTISGESMMYYQQMAVMKLRFGIEMQPECLREGREAVAIAVALRTCG